MSDSTNPNEMDAALEAEIAAALGDGSIADMMDAVGDASDAVAEEAAEHERGRVGVVAGISGSDVLVELGPKDQGIVALEQFKEPPAKGERFALIAERFDEGEGLWVLSRPGGTSRATFDTLAVGLTVEAVVTGENSGGLELEVAKQSAFMPVSHIELHRVEDLERYIGQKLRAEIVELDLRKKRIILSRRGLLEREREAELEKAMSTLAAGAVIPGTVQKLADYGAFVEIAPGVTGLAHISDLCWERIKHPSEIVKEGDQLMLQVLSVDRENSRIALGLKQVTGDPWTSAANKYTPGETVTGKVTRCEAYGAFVQLEPGVEGLVHVSQLAAERVRRTEDVAKPGEQVTVKILDIDTDKRRISLSIKALTAKDSEDASEHVSAADIDRYVTGDADASKSRAMESLMGKFGEDGGLKGGIG